MTKEGLAARDRYVLGILRDAGIPTAISMAGGYARDTEDTVDIHVTTLRIAAEMWSETGAFPAAAGGVSNSAGAVRRRGETGVERHSPAAKETLP